MWQAYLALTFRSLAIIFVDRNCAHRNSLLTTKLTLCVLLALWGLSLDESVCMTSWRTCSGKCKGEIRLCTMIPFMYLTVFVHRDVTHIIVIQIILLATVGLLQHHRGVAAPTRLGFRKCMGA